MAGETDLGTLLACMTPRLKEGVYVFASLPPGTAVPPSVDPVMTFCETEGTTLVLEESDAGRAGIEATFRSRMITLEIHSSLDAVGFLAAITTRLAAAGMGVNPVSAFYHDHLFVPAERAAEAVEALERLAAEARGSNSR
jgi:hypothetical protein